MAYLLETLAAIVRLVFGTIQTIDTKRYAVIEMILVVTLIAAQTDKM